jgi:hypothetical protein
MSSQGETSHYNRYLGNHMGTSAGGDRLPNGIDFFWDGEGTGNCWQTSGTDVVQPLAMPACPAGNQHRFISDPNTVVLFANCSGYDLAKQAFPAGCDWFETPPRPGTLGLSANIEIIAPAVQLIVLMVLCALLVRRDGRPGPLSLAALLLVGLGSVLLVAASLNQLYFLAAPGAAVLGLGWLAAVRVVPTERLAVLTLLLGVVALLEAVDSGILLVPSPIGPVWIRVMLEVVWIVWTGVALVRVRRSPRPA